MNQGERHDLLRLEAGPKRTPFAKWILTQFKGTTRPHHASSGTLPRSGCEHQVTTTGCPAGIMEDDGIGEKPWQLPEAPPLLKEESITYEIVNNWQNPVRISLGIPSKVETNERSEATAATDPGLGLDPRVSPGFFSATNNGHLSAIYPSIHPSITSVRSRIHLLCPSEQNPPSSLICFSTKR